MEIKPINCVMLVLVLWLSGCGSPAEQRSDTGLAADQEREVEAGFTLVQQNCIACHSPAAVEGGGIAPSLEDIRAAYLKDNPSATAFTNRMLRFLLEPSVQTSQMPEAINRYGLMPKMGFDSLEYRQIAAYLYQVNATSPRWFDWDSQKFGLREDLEQDPMAKGKEIALSTKTVLGSNLLAAIKNKGTAGAVEFCHLKAIPLTDSMQRVNGTQIRRVSDRPRNPDNMANQLQLDYIEKAKSTLESGGKVAPFLRETTDAAIGYYPIVTNQMCLQCHGMPVKDILPQTLTRIEKLYPLDMATGYGENELRGIWVIEMPK
jgi:mono/diheme cytochrome c family protein